MSLLEKASIITTPTAYGVGVLNSIKPAYALGEELVTNGNFSNGTTGWTPGGSATISIENGRLKIAVSGSSNALVLQNITTEIGKKYIITANAYIGTATKVSLQSPPIGFNDLTADGSYNLTFTATSTSTQLRLYVYGDGSYGFWDNVSVKKVTDADFDFTRTSSATRVNPDYLLETVSINSANLVQNGNFSELGAEEITNGNFATDSDWVKSPSGMTISGGFANFTSGQDTYVFQDIMTIGKQYYMVLEYNISSLTGSAYFGSNGGSGNAIISMTGLSGSGTLSGYITASASKLIIRSSTLTGTITNVSVKQVDPNDNWTLGTGWSYGTNKITHSTGTGSASRLKQYGFNNTSVYKITITITNKGTNSYRIFGGDMINVILSEGTNTYLVSGLLAGVLIIEPINHPGGDVEFSNISIIEIQENGVPRLDYTNGTASILLEPQSTNLIPYSEDFSSWSRSGSVIQTNNYGISPEGKINSTRLQLYNNSIVYVLLQAPFDGTRSLYVKATSGSGTIQLLSHNTNTDNIFTIDENWQRVELTDVQQVSQNFYLVDTRGGSNTTIFDIEVWGAQYELLDYATSYIPTSGSAVTRAAETLNNAGNSDLINSTEGVLYAEIAALANDGTNRAISISDGTTSNVVRFYYSTTDNRIVGNVKSGGSSVFNFNNVLSNAVDFIKIAIKYKANDFKMYVNSVEVSTDTSGAAPIGLKELAFDNGAGNDDFFGRCKSLAVFKEALSDTELACLTSTNNREIFLNYYYRMQYVEANTEALSCAEQTFNI